MAYKLFDIDGNEVMQHDLQDKGVWCKAGASKEEVFVEKFGNELNLIINPQKLTDPYAPDLFNISTDRLADLKTQNTPFFQAKLRYSFDPQYTVVFNGKDRDRYRNKYPEIEIYFAVDWQVIRFEGGNKILVKPMTGVWYAPFMELDKLLNKSPFHYYYRRIHDKIGNAKGSYILNLNNPIFNKVV